MKNLTEENLQKLIDNNNDIQQCQNYYNEIYNGNYQNLNEANKFAINKYDELCLTDIDIVAARNVTKNTVNSDRLLINETLGNLQEIYKLLVAKVYKIYLKENK